MMVHSAERVGSPAFDVRVTRTAHLSHVGPRLGKISQAGGCERDAMDNCLPERKASTAKRRISEGERLENDQQEIGEG